MSAVAYSAKGPSAVRDGSAMSTSLFGSVWFQVLCVPCATYCLWLCWKIAPVLAALIRAGRVRLEAHERHGNPRSISGSSSCTPAHGMPTGQRVPIVREQTPNITAQEPEAASSTGSTAIRLGSGKSLSKMDLLRCLLCSFAVYMDNVAAMNLLKQAKQEFPSLQQFEKVHISLDHPDWKHIKYLVAYAADAIIIAFQGTHSLVDLADDLTIIKTSSRHGGKFHAGFSKRSESFLGPNNKLDELLQSGKRIILCGHSLGGAVAHMVLMRYILEKDIVLTPETHPDSLFSIGFGAPHVCDADAAGAINQDENMKWRFINIVNQADPIPRYLHHLPSTLVTVLKEAPTYFTESDSILAQLGGFVGEVLNGHATGEMPDLGRLARRVSGAIVAHTWQNYVDKCTSTLRYRLWMLFKSMTQTTPDPEFHPVGQYVFLTRRRPVQSGDDWGPWGHKTEGVQNREMTELRIIKSGRYGDLEHHTLVNYRTALIRTSLLDSPQLNTFQSSDPDQRNLDVSTPSPVIIHAQLDTSLPEHRLCIKGQNLLFLYEPIRINGDHKRWQILNPVTDTELELRRAGRTSMRVITEPAMLLISIKTAFGHANKQIVVKESVKSKKSQGTQSLLKSLVQVLALKASSPMNRIPHEDVLKQLDHIVHCATPLQNSEGNLTYLSSLFTAIQAANPETDITQHIVDANNIIEKVLTFLLDGRFESIDHYYSEPSSSSSATPTSTWGQKIWKGGKIAGLVSGAAVGAGVVATGGGALVLGFMLEAFPAAQVAITSVVAPACLLGAVGAGGKAGVMVYRGMTSTTQPASSPQRSQTLHEYLEWLKLAIEEASRWRTDGGRPLDNTVSTREPAAYEEKLLEQVEASPEFKRMIEHSYCNDPNSCKNRPYHVVQLRSPEFRAASPNLSPKQLLQRINIVVKTHALYKQEGDENVVTVVGAQDAGKSTFIKEVMKKFGSPRKNESQMPETGARNATQHTKDVRLYAVTKKLDLVDFPGENGIGNYTEVWKQFCMLPGSAILFLHFQDDLTRDQRQMYQIIKQGLEKNPIVVFNKVDKSFTPEQDEIYTAAYFEDQRQKTATVLDCDPKDVYYMSVLPNSFQTAQRCEMMRSRGVLDLETFADKVLHLRSAEPATLRTMLNRLSHTGAETDSHS